MRISDLNVGQQLRLGLGAILAFVVILGLMAWDQAQSLWEETKGLYDHPFAVRRALGEMKADIIAMQLGMRGLCLADSEGDRASIIQAIDTHEADAHQQLHTVVWDRYLGPRGDLEAATRALAQWRAYREETIRLLRAGRAAEAIARTNTGPAGGPNALAMAPVQVMIDFAENRATQYYSQALGHKDSLLARTALALGAILLMSLAISYVLLKGIRGPLRDLTEVAEAYGQGRLEARSHYQGSNEFGVLATSLNALLDRVQAQGQRRENAAKLAEVMLKEEELAPFCHQLLVVLMELTDAQAGGVYLLDEGETSFQHYHSIGLGQGARAVFSATDLEGQFGPALATRRTQRTGDIPEDTPFDFVTLAGQFRPREILTIPILVGQKVAAMVSLASLKVFQGPALDLLDDIHDTLSARLGGVLAFQQVTRLAQRLEEQNRELEHQQQVLAAQTAELGEQNVELEMQKRQLDESNRLKSSFLANMSHELRTPLNSVIALAGVLHRRLKGRVPGEEYGYLEVIERNGKHLLELINGILDLSRIEAGREEINLGRFSLRELLEDVISMLEPQVRDKDLTLVGRVDPGLPPLRSDTNKCRHILQNLVANAIKFTDAGRVEVSAARQGETVRVTVTDTGIGIAAEHLPHVFDEFRQADESAARRYGGTGLGLAIARKYAILLGGGIEVQSTPGQGSTFTLWLPLTPDPALAEALSPPPYTPPARRPAAASGPAAPGGRGGSILVVEDSEPAVIQLQDILSGEGYQVRVARNGREALNQIELARPNALILDLMMPEVDGFQVLRAIRSDPQARDLPVLILTAKHVTQEELSFLKGNHIHQLIQKGDISRDELLAAIAGMVSPPAPAPVAPPAPAAQPRRTGPPLILVVDDDADNLTTLQALLHDAYRVISAGDGPTGLRLALERHPDLILLAVAPAGRDGFQTLERLKGHPELGSPPVIALAEQGLADDRAGLLARGFAGCLGKPVDAELLTRTLREALHER
ncbi:MAG: response regulator [Pseudomonadota bacterium]